MEQFVLLFWLWQGHVIRLENKFLFLRSMKMSLDFRPFCNLCKETPIDHKSVSINQQSSKFGRIKNRSTDDKGIQKQPKTDKSHLINVSELLTCWHVVCHTNQVQHSPKPNNKATRLNNSVKGNNRTDTTNQWNKTERQQHMTKTYKELHNPKAKNTTIKMWRNKNKNNKKAVRYLKIAEMRRYEPSIAKWAEKSRK